MEKIIWGEEFSIGNQLIDQHHQKLMEMVNAVMDLSEQESPDERDYLMLLTNLNDYVGYHFHVEEGVMRAVGYPDLESHTDFHISLTEKASALVLSRDIGQIGQVADFLSEWLRQHILVEDMKLKPYLSETK